MTEFALENTTKQKCLECGDTLTVWENKICILCDAESELELECDWDDE